jgi:AraC-like DNA-binding protein
MVILLGALQGFIFAILLFVSSKGRPANRLLGWLLFLAALASLKLFMSLKGWFDLPGMQLVDALVPMIVPMPIGPLIYFYVKSSLDPDFRLSAKDRLHFLWVIVDLVPNLVAFIFVWGALTLRITSNPGPWGLFIDDYNIYADIPRWFCITIYLWLAARQITSSKVRHGSSGSGQAVVQAPAPAHSLRWLQQFIKLFLVFQCIWLLYLVPYVIPKYTDFMLGRFGWYPVYIPLTVLIYWLGIKGYLVSQTFSVRERIVGLAKVDAAKPENQSALQPVLVEKIIFSLRSAMEQDKLFLDPELTVATIAEHTGIGQKHISAVLNQHMHKSFNEFVNGYRINGIRQRMLSGDAQHLTIAGMAYEGGFNSLPTFQRAFKSILGQTPKEFLADNADQIRI